MASSLGADGIGRNLGADVADREAGVNGAAHGAIEFLPVRKLSRIECLEAAFRVARKRGAIEVRLESQLRQLCLP